MALNSNLPCDIVDVVDLLNIRVVRRTGTQLECRCPFCDDKRAHLNVRISKNVFRCNRCGKGGGVLHLYAAAQDVNLNTAYEELSKLFASDSPHAALKRKGSPDIILRPELTLASSQVRDNTYRNLLSLLSLGSTHRESLLRRGLSEEDIERLGYKTTPAVRTPKIVTELIERGCELKGVPGFYCDEHTGRWMMDIRTSGIMIPDINCRGEIEAIQIRVDQETGGKYKLLSSVDRYYGASASCCPHYVGFTDETDSAFLTEGVLKADVAYSISKHIGSSRAFVGLTGVSNFNQCNRAYMELRGMGIRNIYVAFDMDADTNQTVAQARDRVILDGVACGFNMELIEWDKLHKGIDDFLLAKKVSRC